MGEINSYCLHVEVLGLSPDALSQTSIQQKRLQTANQTTIGKKEIDMGGREGISLQIETGLWAQFQITESN